VELFTFDIESTVSESSDNTGSSTSNRVGLLHRSEYQQVEFSDTSGSDDTIDDETGTSVDSDDSGDSGDSDDSDDSEANDGEPAEDLSFFINTFINP
jgi:hypothetical protein